jgi:PAS domain S-box-containing protein
MPPLTDPTPPLEGKYHAQLTSRNALLTLLLFVIPFIVLYFAVKYESSSLIKGQIYGRLAETVEENAKSIALFLNDRESDLRSYSRIKLETIEDVSRLKPLLQSLLEDKKWYDFLIIASLDGNIVLSINRDIQGNIAKRDYFQASRAGKPYPSSFFYSDIIHSPVLVTSCPLTNTRGQIIGVLAASLNIKNFYDLLFNLRLGRTSELFLVDGQGTLLSPTKLGGKPLSDKGFGRAENNPHTGEAGVKTHLDYRGQKVLCAYKKMSGTNFYLVSEMDLAEALLPGRELNRIMLFSFLPFFFLLVALSILFSRRVTALLKKLTRTLQEALRESQAQKKEVDRINIQLEGQVKESETLTQELKQTDEYILSLIDSISLGVIGLDDAGRITHSNREMRALFNLEGKVMGENIFSLLPWFHDREIESAYQTAVFKGKPTRLEEKKIERGKADEYFNLAFFPIEDGHGRILGVTILFENITDRKRLRLQLADYEKLSALSQLALGAAHEINNPLLGISSYLELLHDSVKTAKEKEEVEFVLENVYRISSTIRGLLSFARPTPPQFTKVNLNQLIDDTLSFMSLQPIFRKITIIKNLAPLIPQITADLNQIRQVLTNMFLNAAQAMPDGGELKIETQKVKFQELIQVDITDTGLGIPAENLKKIFEPFFTTKKSAGTGLGLSISLSYMKNHEGDILVRSDPGRGTTFTLILPIRQKGRLLLQDEEVIS